MGPLCYATTLDHLLGMESQIQSDHSIVFDDPDYAKSETEPPQMPSVSSKRDEKHSWK